MALTRFPPVLSLLACAALFSTLPSTTAQQQEIECLVPHRMGEGQRPVYNTGETVQLQWKSTFPTFNLSIVQANSETQSKTYVRRFENESNSTSNLFWTARNMAGLSQDDPMHLWIVNAADKDCETCSCRSANFTVLNAAVSDTTTTSTSAPGPTTIPSPSASTSPTPPDNHLKLGLGLGLGLGIPLLILLTALTTWICARRRRHRRDHRASTSDHPAPFPHPSLSTTMPWDLTAATPQPSSGGYVSDPSKKSPAREMDGSGLAELQMESAWVEAPPDCLRAELEGDVRATGGATKDAEFI